ncbi:hypothetical protein A9Q86_04550 [Flavobacteriales bacterium 33_180_T64]|nr:hypothetical protein A9Q86_04550 [Flavobacteriales bacterium 33_180_T64]
MLSASCSSDDIDVNSSIIGSWKLTNYNIGVSVDIDKDDIENLNLLNELNCSNNEILIFESNGTVSSNDTFNPNIDISKSNLNGDYVFYVECAEGVIGFATLYNTLNDDTVEFNDKPSAIIGNTLTRVFENVIEVYNEDFSEIIETKHLTLIYTKQ